MPSLDLPDNLQVADKLQLFDIAYRRCPKDGSTPYVKMIICTGYYPKDADGNPIYRADEEDDRASYSEYLNNTQAATSNLGEQLKSMLAQKEAENGGEE